MRNTLAIAWREIRTYFASPLAYVVIGVFLTLNGYIFWASLLRFSEICRVYVNSPYNMQLNVNDMVIRPLFGSMGIIFLLMIPVVTMRLLAEEKKTGTAELLFTCPVTSGEVVAGKFLGAAFLLLVMLSVTLAYPLLIATAGTPPDLKPAYAGYFGVFLMGLSFLAVGLLISSLTENQMVAAVGAFGVLLLLWIVNWMAESAATVKLFGRLTLGDLLNELSITEHFQDFRKGLLDTEHVVFYLSVVFMALFLTQRVVESQRWR